MSDIREFEQPLVFGLDIGTRNVVGTVGYRIENEFIVVAQYGMEHETRAMLDGQIHDIGRVGRTINKVKVQLEAQIGQTLTEVCIAAAGRVLKTVTTNVMHEFPEETVVTGEDIHTLDLLGVEKAQEILKEMNDTNYKFYCVGYSVVKYFLNDEPFSSLESHKADKIAEDIIVTFLPEDVVDGLYAAVGMAGLSVANMTLEPIAAINVAIPENFRLLNIALVDIGAGTSDISVTRDGSIIAYGMIPLAGDEITELIVQHYLVDFKTAEHIKMCSGKAQEVTYKDIMMIEHTIPAEEVWELTFPLVDRMTTEVADKIIELNGGQTVSATFVVGGGGKIHGYTEMLAEKLDLPKERVALRGEEVLQEVTFEQADIKKDPLLVTPIGICLNYYDQRNSFIMVRFNGERIKMYDNNHLTIVDAAMQAGFPNEDLFPKRGKELQFTVNGVTRIVRGEPGESAAVYMNDRPANIHTSLEPNSDIIIMPSTQGAAAFYTLEQLSEASAASIVFIVNGRIVRCPNFLEVNGSLELPSYLIQEGDAVETRSFYTVGQLAAFMDVEVDMDHEIMVNNRVATMETLIYENFTIDWTVLSYGAAAVNPEELEIAGPYYDGIPGPDGRLPGRQSIRQLFSGKTFSGQQIPQQPEAAKADGTVAVQPGYEVPVQEAQPGYGYARWDGESADRNVEPEGGTDFREPKGGTDFREPETGTDFREPKNGTDFREPEGGTDFREPETGTDFREPKGGTDFREPETGTDFREPKNGTDFREPEGGTDFREPETGMNFKETEAGPEISDEQTPPEAAEADAPSEEAKAGEPETPEYEAAEERAAEAVDAGAAVAENGIVVYINEHPVRLAGKPNYIFVDIFDYYDFDLTVSHGRAIVTNLNGERAQFSTALSDGDKIELRWKED